MLWLLLIAFVLLVVTFPRVVIWSLVLCGSAFMFLAIVGTARLWMHRRRHQ